jgi:ATP-dependent Clp protease adaptor protein ClpS
MSTEVEISEKIKITVSEPKRWKVILLNDDTTPMEFVIVMLMKIFRHDESTAYDLTMHIHNNGSAVAGVYSHEVAEQKIIDATELAKANNFPLKLKAEAE